MEKNLFESIYGYENIKLELKRILNQLLEPEKYADLGVVEPHGLLFYGIPGVGKSTFAKSFIDATGRKAFVCRKDKSNGEFVNEIVRIFDEAEKAAPSIILLDDIDKFANEDEKRRDSEEFVTVQSCIDRVKEKQVFVVATANNIRKLPDSLVRAGRFDYVLELKCPRGKDAEDIVSYYLSCKNFVADVDSKRIARLLEGKSCAELERIINLAGSYAGYEGRKKLEMKDILRAILRIIFKAPETLKRSEYCSKIVAYHEAGHALIAELLEPGSVNLVTIEAYDSDSLGITSTYPHEDYRYSKELMENRVICVLAGKAATEICLEIVDAGVENDLMIAFHIVQRFVEDYCTYGFDNYIYDKEASNGILERRDTRVAEEMKRYYTLTKQLLSENKEKLEELASLLLKEKTLLGDRVQMVMKAA